MYDIMKIKKRKRGEKIQHENLWNVNYSNTPEDFVGIVQGNIDVEYDAILHKTPIVCLKK